MAAVSVLRQTHFPFSVADLRLGEEHESWSVPEGSCLYLSGGTDGPMKGSGPYFGVRPQKMGRQHCRRLSGRVQTHEKVPTTPDGEFSPALSLRYCCGSWTAQIFPINNASKTRSRHCLFSACEMAPSTRLMSGALAPPPQAAPVSISLLPLSTSCTAPPHFPVPVNPFVFTEAP